MPEQKKYEWLIIEHNGSNIKINCKRKLMSAREFILKNKKTKSKSDIVELLTIRFLSFNNISEKTFYIL